MEEMIRNPFDVFAGVQETYEEAVKKSAEESAGFQKIAHFKMEKAGDYRVRILPLAPVQDKDGNYVLDRKGYEYPIMSNVLKLDRPETTTKNQKPLYVNVCHSKYAGISADLIDTYVEVAKEKYGNDERLMELIGSGQFEGGLKWSYNRCMYIIDLENEKDGIQMLTISFSQYKDLEDTKIKVWKQLIAKDPKCPCPISSIKDAYPTVITRKKEGKKVSYSFSIEALGATVPMSEDVMKQLLEMPRIPENIYAYRRYHLEATIEFLKQYDEKHKVSIMDSKKVADVIEKIKMELPADDKSHFSFDKKERKGGENDTADEQDELTLDSLWDRLNDLLDRGISDKSEEGQELRDDIRAYIDENNIGIRIIRTKSNEDILNDIEDWLENNPDDAPADEPADDAAEDNDPVDDKEPESAPESEPEPERPSRRRDEHNDDTNEPAVGTDRESRRAARPARRRVR